MSELLCGNNIVVSENTIVGVANIAEVESYRPKIKRGERLIDLPIDAQTVQGKVPIFKEDLTPENVGADPTGSASTALEDSKKYTDSKVKDITDNYETKSDSTKKLSEAKKYTDDKVALLMNNSSTAVDSIMELAELMEENEDVVQALDEAIGKKAGKDELQAHLDDKENPHNVTKEQVGLGNVPNVSTNDQTPTYTDTTTLATLVSGEKVSISFSKIKLAITKLIEHISAVTGNPHKVTKSDVGLGSVENKSSSTIRGEITKSNVTTALGYEPPTQQYVDTQIGNINDILDIINNGLALPTETVWYVAIADTTKLNTKSQSGTGIPSFAHRLEADVKAYQGKVINAIRLAVAQAGELSYGKVSSVGYTKLGTIPLSNPSTELQIYKIPNVPIATGERIWVQAEGDTGLFWYSTNGGGVGAFSFRIGASNLTGADNNVNQNLSVDLGYVVD